MTGQQGVLGVAWLAATEAAREFFAPVTGLLRWTSAFLRMPTTVVGLPDRLLESTVRIQAALSEELHSDRDMELILKELQSLKNQLDSIRHEEPREFPDTVHGLEGRIRKIEYTRAEQAVVHYLSLAADFRRRGNFPQASRVLVLLDQLSERRSLRSACYVSFNRGELFFEQGEMSQAESFFRRA